MVLLKSLTLQKFSEKLQIKNMKSFSKSPVHNHHVFNCYTWYCRNIIKERFHRVSKFCYVKIKHLFFYLKTNMLHKIRTYLNFYSCVEWGPRNQFSNWAPQFLAPPLVTNDVLFLPRYMFRPGYLPWFWASLHCFFDAQRWVSSTCQ